MRWLGSLILFATALAPPACGGLYYSGERLAELPSAWRGFLLDQRMLRLIALPPAPGVAPTPARLHYEQAAMALEAAGRTRLLTADEQADLGAIAIRLGKIEKALTLLRAAQREHPRHFHLAANLGTAWQLHGDLGQAVETLIQAVRLAPESERRAESYHLKLVQLRARQPRSASDLDDLFGVRYETSAGLYEPGRLSATARQHLPPDAIALVQLLALWLPADGRLLWQLAELANAQGDVQTAAAIMDGCMKDFGMSAPELRRHRQATRLAADRLAGGALATPQTAKALHEGHASGIRPRSKHPLLGRADALPLPPIRADGINVLPWTLLNETSLDRKFQPTFPAYLQALNGKEVVLEGYMQPIDEDAELARFMLVENPIGCWYCEMPEMTGIVLVRMPPGSVADYTRGRLRVSGKLRINATDAEDFLYTISGAKVADAG